MLVLGRKLGQQIFLDLPSGERITITVLHGQSDSNTIRLGIDAPLDVVIHRGQVKVKQEKEAS